MGDIIGEITAAASEQFAGIGQVNQSVAEIDRMTQQNAALVEESAAAAECRASRQPACRKWCSSSAWLTHGLCGPRQLLGAPHRKACLP